jgi:hypothetical protein
MTVQIFPYVRGEYPRDTMYAIWRMVEEAKAAEHLFWGSQEPDAIKGDLTAIVKFFDDQNRVLIMLSTEDGKDMIGFLWFDDFIPGLRCFGSVFIKPQYRGKVGNAGIVKACQYVFDVFHVKAIWGVTPWREARAAVMACGFQTVTVLKEFVKVGNEVLDAHIVKKERPSDGQHL